MIKFLSRLLTAALSDKKKKALASKYNLEEDKVEELSKLDPTRNSGYVDWICREYKNGKIDSSITDTLKRFDKLKNSPTFEGSKNVFDYTVEEITSLFKRKFREQLKDMSKNEIETKLKSEGLPGGKLILNTGKWKIWKVSNPDYAMILGTGTGWCTANAHHAISYCKDGPLYPIYKNDEPFAQGYFGATSIVLMDKQDHSFNSLTADLTDLLKVSEKAFPEFRLMLRGVFSKLKTITKKEADFFKSMIINNDDYSLLMSYLTKLYWQEGWEMLLDGGSRGMISSVVEKIKPTNGFFESPYVLEVVEMVNSDGLIPLLPYFLKNGKLKDFFVKINHLTLDSFSTEIQKQIVSWIHSVVKSSDNGKAIKSMILDKITCYENEMYSKDVIVPYWDKFGEGKRWPEWEPTLMKYSKEYSDKFKGEAVLTPELTILDKFQVTYNNHKFIYKIYDSHFNCSPMGLPNRSILNAILGLPIDNLDRGDFIRDFLKPIYGYEPGGGDWPTYRIGDKGAIQRVLEALANRGCEITKVR